MKASNTWFVRPQKSLTSSFTFTILRVIYGSSASIDTPAFSHLFRQSASSLFFINNRRSRVSQCDGFHIGTQALPDSTHSHTLISVSLLPNPGSRQVLCRIIYQGDSPSFRRRLETDEYANRFFRDHRHRHPHHSQRSSTFHRLPGYPCETDSSSCNGGARLGTTEAGQTYAPREETEAQFKAMLESEHMCSFLLDIIVHYKAADNLIHGQKDDGFLH